MNSTGKWFAAVLATLPLLSAGCGTEEAQPSGFLQEGKTGMVEDERLPFQRVWYKQNADWTKYNAIRVAPVHTEYLSKQDWWDKVNEAELSNRQADVAKIADYIQKKFTDAFANDENHVLKIAQKDGPGVLVLEIAIVELVPTKALLNAAGYAAMGSAMDQGSIALEARIKDSATGEVLVKIADREEGKASIVNVKDLTWYGHAYDRIDEWAEQAVEVANASENETVDDSWDFTLAPW
ncbi:MAG: DUF3313 domain-containing protein [Planctomycetes bacterium]|nr:DUF3313 domain-containing protein [Planctomycetota bacterium]